MLSRQLDATTLADYVSQRHIRRADGNGKIFGKVSHRMNYGLPYKGSKSRIAPWVIDNLPPAETFVDLFAGGCAMTHAAMLSGNYTNFIANDIGDAPKLFQAAINGEYANETRWISREDFKRLKDTDTYVRLCWSFSNNQENYLYSQEIEPWKKAVHYARVFNDRSLLAEMGINSDGSLRDIRTHHEEYKQKYIRWWLAQQQYTVDELVGLPRLRKSLQSLQSLQRLQSLQSDYQSVLIPDNALVYADPPYRGTDCNGYDGFDFERFDKWLADVPFMVVISEYKCPDGCAEVACCNKVLRQTAKQKTIRQEKLFVQKRFEADYYRQMGRLW